MFNVELQLGSDGNPVIDQLSEDGFVDLTFRVTQLVDDGTCYHFHLAASHENSEVGCNVILVKRIKSGFDANMDLQKARVFREGVRFLRSGEESDRLVSALAQFYAAGTSPKAMVPEETFTAIALHQGHLDFESDCVKLKLFGNDGEPFDEDAYYECFFNVDLANGIVYWNEKDPAYREPLLRALAVD